MMSVRGYPTKKSLKLSVGKSFRFRETTFFQAEWQATPKFMTVVGPSPYERKWFARVRVDANNIILEVK